MSSFLAEANTSKSATATSPPSSIVPENSYYDGLPLFVDYQTSALKFAFVSSANYPFIQISVKTLTNLQIILQQAVNNTVDEFDEPVNPVGNNYVIAPAMNVPGNPALLDFDIPSEMLYFQVTSPFFRLVVVNQSATQLGKLLLTTKLASTRPSNALVQKDSVLIAGINPTSQPTALRTDAEGRLKVDAALTIESITLTPDNDGVRVFGGVDGTNDYKLLNTDSTGKLNVNVVSLTLDATDDSVLCKGKVVGTETLAPLKLDADGTLYTKSLVTSGNILVDNFPALQQIEGEVVLDHTKVGETGSQFVFIPTAANNTASIYADGAQGVTIPNIGWQYTNNPSATLKKINWYIYQSPLPETSYKVSQLDNIYCVINNLSTLLPFFTFYTRPTGTGDAASWHKSRITFTGSNAGGTGMKFLYTGTDPTLIHPEITGVNRIQLVFNAVASTKTPEQAANEIIFTSTLQTDSGVSGAGVFNFILQEYGIVWEKTKVFLPVEFGRVQVKGDVAVSNFPATQVVSGSVSVSNLPATQPVSGSVSVSNLPATQPVSGTIAVSNFPSVQDVSGNVVVSNLGTIESAQEYGNGILEEIAINTIYFTQPPTKYALIDTPTTITSYNVVTNSTLPLKANSVSNVLFRNVMYMGEVDASVFTDPKLIFEYSDDDINYFSDGVTASFNKRGTTWTFAFQRSSIGVKSVRLVAQNTTRISYAVANLSM